MKTLTLSIDKARELDQKAIRDFGIPSFLLMENAGRELAHQIEKVLQIFSRNTLLIFMCGGGNNGGDGFVAARHIYQKHPNVKVYIFAKPEEYVGDALLNFQILSKLEVPIAPQEEFIKDRRTLFQNAALVIVDCMIGTGSRGPAKGPYLDAINQINDLKKYHNAKVKVVAADIPSGLNADEGTNGSPTIMADLTVTFGCIKKGLLNPEAKPYVGKLELVDIGIPEPLLKSFGT